MKDGFPPRAAKINSPQAADTLQRKHNAINILIWLSIDNNAHRQTVPVRVGIVYSDCHDCYTSDCHSV